MNPLATIREYRKNDKLAVLNLLALNTPTYFAPEERADFEHYLDHEREHYLVLEMDGKIVGCGGINFTADGATGKISWDILHPAYQGKSLGTQLLQHRIDQLKATETIKKITVRTSQVAYQFYEKGGFELVEVVPGYWAKGFDLYRMEYRRL